MRAALSVASLVLVTLVACAQPPSSSSPSPVPGAAPAASPGPRMTPEQIAARNDSLQKDRQMHVDKILKQIAGKEELPAEQVYQNIETLKGMPAGRLLNVMNRGFSNSLGVSCSHCHVVTAFDKDDKPEKQIARDMFAMVGTINNTLLKNIKDIKSPNPTVNCGTCHNGRARPGAGGGPQGAPRPPAD